MKQATAQTWDRLRRHKGVAGTAQFMRWWRDELVGSLPDRWRDHLKTEAERVLVRFENGQFVLLRSDGSELGRLPREEDPAITAQNVQALLLRLDEDRPVIHFLLDPARVLRRKVTLPAAAEDNLAQVIGFEMDRHTPFKSDQVYFDCRVEERLAGGSKLKIDVVLARREDVEYTARFCRERGLRLHGIDVADGASGRVGVNLLPPALRAERDRRQLKINIGLAALFAVLLYGVMWQSVAQREQAIETYQGRLDELKDEAKAVAALRDELDEAAAAASFLAEQKRARPTVVQLLSDLTERLPDEVWLQRLQIQGDTVQISGQAPETARLVAELDAGSEYLESPAIRGAVTPDPQSGKERFTIEATIEQEEG